MNKAQRISRNKAKAVQVRYNIQEKASRWEFIYLGGSGKTTMDKSQGQEN